MGFVPEKSGICPNLAAESNLGQIPLFWDLASNCGAGAARSAEKNNTDVWAWSWCGRCMDPVERCWNVCAKPARGRAHPVAVVS